MPARALPCCPHCGGALPAQADEPDSPERLARIAALRMECSLRSIPIVGAGEVREADAARLIAMCQKTLRNRRSEGDPNLPAGVKRRGSWFYSLSALADWLEAA